MHNITQMALHCTVLHCAVLYRTMLFAQALVCSPNASFMATIPPAWARAEAWRATVRSMLQGLDLNNSQKK